MAPAILGAMLVKCRDEATIQSVFEQISAFDTGVLQHSGDFSGQGEESVGDPQHIFSLLLDRLFGGKLPAVVNSVAAFSGIKHSAALAIFQVAGPLTFAWLAQKITREQWLRDDLVQWLQTEQPNILGLIPGSLAVLLGFPNTGRTPKPEQTTGREWLWSLLILILIGAWCWYLAISNRGF